MSCAGPEGLFGLNQIPERFSVPPFHLLQDNDNNMYLGSVVAAQVLEPSPQTSYPWKEKKVGGGGGVHPLQTIFRSLIPGSRYRLPLRMLRLRSFCYYQYI